MKMKKLFAGLVATSMVAAMGTSVFAEEIANDAGYDKTAGTYSIVSDLSTYGTDQMTIIIIPEAAYNAETISDADILYIDQAAADTEGIFANVCILGGTELTDGTYYVKIGGENIAEDGIIVEKFTITTTAAGVEVQLGDTTGEGDVDVSDINPIIQHILGAATLTGQTAFQADTTGEGDIDVSDINPIIQHILGATTLGTGMYVAE